MAVLELYDEKTERKKEESPCSVVVNVLDCDIVVSEFELQSYYYVRFRGDTLRKAMNPLHLPVMDSTPTALVMNPMKAMNPLHLSCYG